MLFKKLFVPGQSRKGEGPSPPAPGGFEFQAVTNTCSTGQYAIPARQRCDTNRHFPQCVIKDSVFKCESLQASKGIFFFNSLLGAARNRKAQTFR